MAKDRFEYQDLLFWAERGLVRIIDRRDGSYVSLEPAIWRERADNIRAELRHVPYSDERRAIEKVALEMYRIAAAAEHQGCPLDGETLAWFARHKQRSWSAIGTLPGHHSLKALEPGRRSAPEVRPDVVIGPRRGDVVSKGGVIVGR